MKAKEVRKLLNHYMKLNQNLAPGQKQLTELQAKLHYLKILSQLKAFGGKCFVATFVVSFVAWWFFSSEMYNIFDILLYGHMMEWNNCFLNVCHFAFVTSLT